MNKKDLKMFFDDTVDILQKYEKPGRYYHTLSPSDNSPVVVHKSTNQITYILNGNGKVVLNSKAKRIKKGDIVLINAGVTHQFFAKSAELTLFHIHLPDEGRDSDRFIVQGEDYNRYEA